MGESDTTYLDSACWYRLKLISSDFCKESMVIRTGGKRPSNYGVWITG